MREDSRGYFLSQPHQPFFTFGIINSILFITLFMLSYKGIINLTILPNTFHAYSLIFGVFTPFFLGFLLTTFPRFSQTMPLEKSIYITNFALLSVAILLFVLGAILSIYLLYIGVIVTILAQIYSLIVFYQIYKGSPLPDLYDQKWIMIGFSSGVVANILFVIGFFTKNTQIIDLAKLISVYLYLTITAFSVGQRMIPFFSHVLINKDRKLLPSIFILFTLYILSKTFGIKIGFFFLFVAGVILAKEIKRWRLPFFDSKPILWILHLAIFWFPFALIFGSLAEFAEFLFDKNFIFLTIHLLMLGFLTTVMIGFGTRVTLGHSGNNIETDRWTKILFYLTQIVIYFRALYSFSGSFIIFDITITIWLILFIFWAIKYLPVLIYGKRVN